MRSTIFCSAYEHATPFEGVLVVALGEDGTVLGATLAPKGSAESVFSFPAYVRRFNEYYPAGWRMEWVSADERDEHTDFQIALGLHREQVRAGETATHESVTFPNT